MRIKIIFILLFILLFMLAGFVYGAIPSEERAALIALYESTNGDGWFNKDGWKGNHDESDGFSKIGSEGNWYGIKVTANRVKFIDLDNNNLVGTIPEELGNLKNLNRLYLYNNQLTGSIPPELGDLSNLVGLSLVFNQLSGPIPTELGNLTNLKRLYLYYNQLTGSIPGELGMLTILEELYLNNNQLSGEIPPRLGNLSYLKRLYLCYNQLTGSIPVDLRKLKDLEELSLNNNQLSEKIPPGLENLSKLRILYLSSNQLTGDIPDKLDTLSNLEELYLNDNFLDGAIPSDLGNLSKLRMLYLSRNRLTDSIPTALGNLSNLVGLYLNDNNLGGMIPTELGNFPKLIALYLSRNQLTGNIPQELGNLNNLLVLRLNSNQLQGSITPKIKSLKKLLEDISDFGWNALYTDDKDVMDFLNKKQVRGNWENTQTITPKDVKTEPVPGNSVKVSWTRISYSNDPGGYEVLFGTTPGGPYPESRATASKSESSLEVTGLTPSTTYYFVVQTRTDPHANNNNTVFSEKSAEVSATTIEADKLISGKVTDAAGIGMKDVTLTFSSSSSTGTGTEEKKVISKADGTYECKIHHGWDVTVTPSKEYSLFSPRYRMYADVTEDKTGQNFQLSLTLTLSATWEEDKTTIIKIAYGKIKLIYERIDPEGLTVNQLAIYRKISGNNNYELIASFPNPATYKDEFSHNDKYLDKNKSYTYIARALDVAGNILGESNEISIAANNL